MKTGRESKIWGGEPGAHEAKETTLRRKLHRLRRYQLPRCQCRRLCHVFLHAFTFVCANQNTIAASASGSMRHDQNIPRTGQTIADSPAVMNNHPTSLLSYTCYFNLIVLRDGRADGHVHEDKGGSHHCTRRGEKRRNMRPRLRLASELAAGVQVGVYGCGRTSGGMPPDSHYCCEKGCFAQPPLRVVSPVVVPSCLGSIVGGRLQHLDAILATQANSTTSAPVPTVYVCSSIASVSIYFCSLRPPPLYYRTNISLVLFLLVGNRGGPAVGFALRLWACRGRGFARLVGVDDARGDRGIVAVAERGGGRVRLLHYAPALRPFYPTEITHLRRSGLGKSAHY